jgi:AcrR family transcriptional regulator
MVKKAPRRTAERILEVALALLNRYGEPNVSTTLMAAELQISPGNLYYHYASKEELINALFDRHEAAMARLLPASADVRDVEDVWFFMHTVFEHIWAYRFLYRDLNDLLSNNRRLEIHFKSLLDDMTRSVGKLLQRLQSVQALAMPPEAMRITATNMVVVLTYWFSYEYACNPRQALEDASAQQTLLRGGSHVLHQLTPYLEPSSGAHLHALLAAYRAGETSAAVRSETPRPAAAKPGARRGRPEKAHAQLP